VGDVSVVSVVGSGVTNVIASAPATERGAACGAARTFCWCGDVATGAASAATTASPKAIDSEALVTASVAVAGGIVVPAPATGRSASEVIETFISFLAAVARQSSDPL
jgi:hypothetical protein